MVRFKSLTIIVIFYNLFFCTCVNAQTAYKSWYEKIYLIKNKLKQVASSTFQQTKKWKKSYENLKGYKLPEIPVSVKNTFNSICNYLNSKNRKSEKQKQQDIRKILESLGKLKISSGSKNLNDYARNIIIKHFPTLHNTDFLNDPAKTLSYYLVLDLKGLIQNVKLIKGPLGAPMTLKEAYQYYKNINPEKAQKILNMLDNLQNLTNPSFNLKPQEKLKYIMESLKENFDLINETTKKKNDKN